MFWVRRNVLFDAINAIPRNNASGEKRVHVPPNANNGLYNMDSGIWIAIRYRLRERKRRRERVIWLCVARGSQAWAIFSRLLLCIFINCAIMTMYQVEIRYVIIMTRKFEVVKKKERKKMTDWISLFYSEYSLTPTAFRATKRTITFGFIANKPFSLCTDKKPMSSDKSSVSLTEWAPLQFDLIEWIYCVQCHHSHWNNWLSWQSHLLLARRHRALSFAINVFRRLKNSRAPCAC